MTSRDTEVGHIVSVSGSTILTRLKKDMAGVAPIWRGRVHAVGQVGTLVALPQGASRLLAVVTELTITGDDGVDAGGIREMRADLVGEITGAGRFERGVTQYPSLGDPVHFVTDQDVAPLFPPADTSRVALGRLSSSPAVTATLDLGALVMRHSAVVGSTGSGKSSTVASILQRVAEGPWPSASVTVIDTHGEYGAALKERARVLNLADAADGILPYWLLRADELVQVLEPRANVRTRERLGELIRDERVNFSKTASWIDLVPEEINEDTPIPFDLREVWFRLDSLNRQTFSDAAHTTEAISNLGSSEDLKSSAYLPYAPGNKQPFKGPDHGQFGISPDKIRRGIMNPLNTFTIAYDITKATTADPMGAVLEKLLGLDETVNVLDVSGVSVEAAQVVVSTVLSLVYEFSRHSDGHGIGPTNPLLLVVDEAHRYFADTRTRSQLDRIAREGRKYGVGLMLVTQRPHELPPTALAQIGTFFSLRLNNSSDQGVIAAALPDSIGNLTTVLPSLRTGEALITGEAISIPSRVLIDRPSPQPGSSDPPISQWMTEPKSVKLEGTISEWRRFRD